jgi:hypothetical protein
MRARRRSVLIFLCAVGTVTVLSVCQRKTDQPTTAVLAEARRQLEARALEDQAVREGFGEGGTADIAQARAMMRVDSSNTAWLKDYVERWGWPTTEQVGKEAVMSAFLIVQHAVQDTAFMRAMLPSIEDAYRRGDLEGGAVAMLSDRVAVKSGRPQVYGTQLSLRDGRWVLDPIADSVHVDERRREMGLPPLADYLRLIDSVMAAPE